MPKHWFFDLDNTLTRSRSLIKPEHVALLKKLAAQADVVVVSGGQRSQIENQLGPEMRGLYYVLAQSGNEAHQKDGAELWLRKPSPEQKEGIRSVIDKMKAHLGLEVKDENDLIEDRGCSVVYSTIGHHEDVPKKEAYDPDHSKRRNLLEIFRDDIEKFLQSHHIEVRPAGTTCFDFYHEGKHKGYNITELLQAFNWNKDDCIYVGDALFPGGNDETVVGVIPTHAVQNPDETFAYIASFS